MEQSRLHGDRLALLMLDLDNFKTINDRYGHSLGDIILVEMSRLLKASLRKHDLLARWGGDEFILTLPRTNATQALQFADQLRLQCSVHPFPAVRTITLCIGVAELGSDETLRQWLNRADTMLGTAKNAGRNTVKLSI
jgi:diguanylate cyclase (GGDEF)-like protein